MKLSRCLLASDSNPDYLGFYPLVRHAWREIVGVDTHLVLVADRIPESLREFESSITVFPPLADIPTGFQAQCIRLLYPSLLTAEPGAVILSDLDMAPAGSHYFNAPLAGAGDDAFVLYRDGVLDAYQQLPICYNAAPPRVWAEVFPGIRNAQDAAEMLGEWWAGVTGPYGIREGVGWGTDQIKLYEHFQRWSAGAGAGRAVRVDDGAFGFLRLDRAEAAGFERLLRRRAYLLRAGYVSDVHLMQPPEKYARLNGRAVALAQMPASVFNRARAEVRLRIWRWKRRRRPAPAKRTLRRRPFGPARSDLLSIINMLVPHDLGVPLVRLGSQGDGGYLVPDDLEGIAACFSPGVGLVADFEIDLQHRGIPSVLADNSVDGPPRGLQGATFIRKHVGADDDHNTIEFNRWIDTHIQSLPAASDLILEMDIEGAEYQVLPLLTEANLKRFRIMVIEFHRLDKLHERRFYLNLQHILRRVGNHFEVCHIHPNNCEDTVVIDRVEIPRVLEVTFLRRDRVRSRSRVNKLPHSLDRRNGVDRKDITLPPYWLGDHT